MSDDSHYPDVDDYEYLQDLSLSSIPDDGQYSHSPDIDDYDDSVAGDWLCLNSAG